MSRGTVGLLVACVLLSSALSSIPFSLLVGKIKTNTLVLILSVTCCAPVLSLWTSNFTTLLLLRICFGISVGGLFPILAPVMMRWFPKNELPLINAAAIASVSAGIAISFLTGEHLAASMGWKMTLSVFSSMSILSAIFWFLLSGRDEIVASSNLSITGIRSVIRSKVTLLLAFGDTGALLQYVALSAWLPTYYFERHGMSLAEASLKAAILPICGLFIVVAGGLLSLRIKSRKPFMFISGITLGICGFSSVIFADSPLLLLILILYGAGTWLYVPFLATIPLEVEGSTPEKAAAMTACMFTIGGSLSFIAPIMIGFLADYTGSYIYGFAFVGVISWSLFVATYFLPETGYSGKA